MCKDLLLDIPQHDPMSNVSVRGVNTAVGPVWPPFLGCAGEWVTPGPGGSWGPQLSTAVQEQARLINIPEPPSDANRGLSVNPAKPEQEGGLRLLGRAGRRLLRPGKVKALSEQC